MFRYWDGQAWSPVVSPTPLPGPPEQYGATPTLPSTPPAAPSAPVAGAGAYPQAGGAGTYAPGGTSAYAQFQTLQATKPKKPVGMWVTIAIGVVVLAVVAYFIATRVLGGVVPAPSTEVPTDIPTTQVCPTMPDFNERSVHPDDGRVYGGKLSYSMLGDPWSAVETTEIRVPFGRDVAQQEVFIHVNDTGVGDWEAWVAAVLVGELNAGDGFFSPEQASGIVNRCIQGVFYGPDSVVTPTTMRSEAYSVDGYDGWITETNLSFSIPNLPTTNELAIVIIVATSELSSSIFYASIPGDAMALLPDVRAAMDSLAVSS
jgi:hypothetical protein